MQAPYLFVTFKPYADRNQILKGDLSELNPENQSHAPFMQDQESAVPTDPQKARNHRMAAISFAATNFPMENLIQVDEDMAFDEDASNPRQFQRSIVQVDLAEMAMEAEKKKEAEPVHHHNHNQNKVVAKSSSQIGDTKQFQK